MEDVLDVYQRPPTERRPLICLDETGKALQASKRAAQPPAPGQPAREDYEYVRQGSSNLFLAVAPHLGWRKVRVTAQRTASDLAEELRQLVEEDFAAADGITLVTDNLNTHTLACLYERFPAEQARRIAAKIEWHYTPEHGRSQRPPLGLAEHRRDRARGAGAPVPGSALRRSGGPGPGYRRVGGRAQRPTAHRPLAVHDRRCSYQAQTLVSGAVMS